MGFAALLMIAMAPMTEGNARAINILLDRRFGQSWEIIPIFALIPFVAMWIIYSILISLCMYFLLRYERE